MKKVISYYIEIGPIFIFNLIMLKRLGSKIQY